MLPAYILGSGRRESAGEPSILQHHQNLEDGRPQQVAIVNSVFRRRLNRFYRGKWEAALQEKWILTVTCGILFIGTTVIFILNVFTVNYAEASEESVNLWWKIFQAEKNSGLWPEDPDTGDSELSVFEEELQDLREQITIAKETSNAGIFLGVFTLVVNIMGLVALVKENRDLLQWHGVSLGIDELMLMTLAGSLFNSSIRIQSSVKRLTYSYPTKGTCITKLVHYEGKCPVFLTLTCSARFSAFAASLGAVLMAWVAIAYVQLYMTVLIGRQCKPGHEEESFVVTWYKDRLLPHKKPKEHKNAFVKFVSDAMNLFGVGRQKDSTSATMSSSSDHHLHDGMEMAKMLAGASDHRPNDLCSIELRPPSSLAVLIQEEITTTPVTVTPASGVVAGVHHHYHPLQGSPTSSHRGSSHLLQVESVGMVHARSASRDEL